MHVAANLMKIWLRSLPEPLVPFQLYQAAVDAGASNDPSDALQVSYDGCFEREGKREREGERERDKPSKLPAPGSGIAGPVHFRVLIRHIHCF